jgi:hypothetical protein
MSEPPEPTHLADALTALMRWLVGEGIDGAVIGGVAASILGRPRLTRDVDAVILAEDHGWDRLLDSAARYGMVPRIDDPLELAQRARVLLFRHEGSGVDLDISLGGLPFEREVVARSSIARLGSVEIRLATAEDVVIMKALARRPRDLADIESILDVQSGIVLGVFVIGFVSSLPFWKCLRFTTTSNVC